MIKNSLKLTALVSEVRKYIADLPAKPNHRTLALWAADCAEHVLPHFEEKHPDDDRPRKAIEGCRAWVATGIFRMADVRKKSLDAHAAAREAKEDDAIAAARSAGQAMATPHVPDHALGAAMYALKAAAINSEDVDVSITKECDWQFQRLLSYMNEGIVRRTKRH